MFKEQEKLFFTKQGKLLEKSNILLGKHQILMFLYIFFALFLYFKNLYIKGKTTNILYPQVLYIFSVI